MLIHRLIFGTARLVGGANARQARALLERVLAAGVRHVDTAPVYGLGTAEALIGEVLAGRRDVRVTTKVGLEPPRHGVLLSYVRWISEVVRDRPATLAQDHGPAPALEHNPDGVFEMDAMRRSLDRSLRRLRRDRVDLLLLHDPGRADLTAPVAESLGGVLADGRAGAVGYATGAAWCSALAHAAPPSWTAQVASPSTWIGGSAEPCEALNVHSLAKTWFYAKRRDPSLSVAMAHLLSLVGHAGGTDPLSFELAVLYMLWSVWLPEAKLIFATIDAGRLDAFFLALKQVEGAMTPAALAAEFAATPLKT